MAPSGPLLWLTLVLAPAVLADSSCPSEELTVYRVRFETHWSPRDFPKHYPEWRPPAQFSKLLGVSHSKGFVVFRAGLAASPALKTFAETGHSDDFDKNAQGEGGVLDMFNAPPVVKGVGESQAEFFVDGNHSRVSLVSKIVPSPDWFVGVDSFELCEDGNWVDNVKIQVDPMDAGTDNGLTFTSPNWPTMPAEKIYRITAHYPDHPAHSFFYPTLQHLPRIATFTISKVKEYELRNHVDPGQDTSYHVVHLEDIAYKHYQDQENSVSYVTSVRTITPDATSTSSPPTTTSPITTTAAPSRPHHRHRVHHSRPSDTAAWKSLGPSKDAVVRMGLEDNVIPEGKVEDHVLVENRRISIMSNAVEDSDDELEQEDQGDVEQAQQEQQQQEEQLQQAQQGYPRARPATRNRIPTGDAMAVIDDIVKNYQKEQRRKMRKQRREQRRRRRMELKKIRPPRDCRVTEWSDWSPCSKTCGIGEQTRTRAIIKHARRGGKACPALDETTWCGSARKCNRNYFNWS